MGPTFPLVFFSLALALRGTSARLGRSLGSHPAGEMACFFPRAPSHLGCCVQSDATQTADQNAVRTQQHFVQAACRLEVCCAATGGTSPRLSVRRKATTSFCTIYNPSCNRAQNSGSDGGSSQTNCHHHMKHNFDQTRHEFATMTVENTLAAAYRAFSLTCKRRRTPPRGCIARRRRRFP